jgi:hypothetical protein
MFTGVKPRVATLNLSADQQSILTWRFLAGTPGAGGKAHARFANTCPPSFAVGCILLKVHASAVAVVRFDLSLVTGSGADGSDTKRAVSSSRKGFVVDALSLALATRT